MKKNIMSSSFAAPLVVATRLLFLLLLLLPENTVSFLTPHSSSRTRLTTNLHGLLPPLPGLVTTTKNENSNDVSMNTELTLESTAATEQNGDATQQQQQQQQLSETQTLLQKVKQAGTAGAISYALWELGFWGVSIPICVVGYYKLTGHWPDISNKEDLEKVGAEAFAFVNFARLAVPLRIGLALSTTPWIDENIVQKFMKKEGKD